MLQNWIFLCIMLLATCYSLFLLVSSKQLLYVVSLSLFFKFSLSVNKKQFKRSDKRMGLAAITLYILFAYFFPHLQCPNSLFKLWVLTREAPPLLWFLQCLVLIHLFSTSHQHTCNYFFSIQKVFQYKRKKNPKNPRNQKCSSILF